MARGSGSGRDPLEQLLTPDAITHTLSLPPVLRPQIYQAPLTQIEDRRLYDPFKPYQPAKLLDGTPATVTPKHAPSRPNNVPIFNRFSAPHDTLVCIRRKTRQQVLHALKKTGRGKGRRNPRNSYWSSISCKR